MTGHRCAAQFMSWTSLASQAATCWLQAHNLPDDVERLADALYAGASLELVVGAAPVLTMGKRLFEIDEGGRWAALQPVWDEASEVVDLIAWHPCAPDRWRFLTGNGEALGEREIELRLDRDGPLSVYATPRSWLRAGGRGMCVLTRQWQVAQRLFDGQQALIAETPELAAWLDQALRFRPSPAIFIQALEQAA